jgi:hypothetical protein
MAHKSGLNPCADKGSWFPLSPRRANGGGAFL